MQIVKIIFIKLKTNFKMTLQNKGGFTSAKIKYNYLFYGFDMDNNMLLLD